MSQYSSDSAHHTSHISHLKRNVLVLVGPTASGKTSVALSLAEELQAEIVSADSRQIYKHMDIGTAKPNRDELESVPHHFIDIITPDQPYNAGEYAKHARATIDEIIDRGKVPIVVGGSGLYIRALVDGLFEGPSADTEVRKKLNFRLHDEGGEKLLDELQSVDSESASKMLPTNTRRIIRALEVYYVTGMPISSLQKETIPATFSSLWVGLQWDRKLLYDRINQRVDMMFSQGLVDEVQTLLKFDYTQDLNALQTVGYKEIFYYLDGKISITEANDLIKRNSRHYAKRQLTWFRHDPRIKWFPINFENELQSVMGDIKRYFRSTAL